MDLQPDILPADVHGHADAQAMAKYLISFPAEAMQLTPGELQQASIDSHAVAAEAKAAGVWVLGGGIDPWGRARTTRSLILASSQCLEINNQRPDPIGSTAHWLDVYFFGVNRCPSIWGNLS